MERADYAIADAFVGACDEDCLCFGRYGCAVLELHCAEVPVELYGYFTTDELTLLGVAW